MDAFFEELDALRADIESKTLTEQEWAVVVRTRLEAVDKLMPLYKKVATLDRVALAEKTRARLGRTDTDLKEAALDAATLEKALDAAVSGVSK